MVFLKRFLGAAGSSSCQDFSPSPVSAAGFLSTRSLKRWWGLGRTYCILGLRFLHSDLHSPPGSVLMATMLAHTGHSMCGCAGVQVPRAHGPISLWLMSSSHRSSENPSVSEDERTDSMSPAPGTSQDASPAFWPL